MSKNSPSVRQLAVLAGVSRTTVSLALRNHPSISLPTRERIHQIADAHGYALDPFYARLMNELRIRRADRTPEKIAFLISWLERDKWMETSYNDRSYYQGACARAAKLGYEIEVFWAKEPGMTGRRLSKILHTRSIRGVIIPPLMRPHGHSSLEWQHFACVALGRTLFKPDVHRVAHFHSEGMLLALRGLRQRGYRRIGYANLLPQDARTHHSWLAAYLGYQYIHEPKNRVPPFLPPVWDVGKFAKWLKAYRVDALVGNLPMILNAPAQIGCRVGMEFGVASLDVHYDGQEVIYGGVDQQPQVQGATAVDVVAATMLRNEFGLPTHPRITQLTGVWVDGSTIGRRRDGKPTAAIARDVGPSPAARGSHRGRQVG